MKKQKIGIVVSYRNKILVLKRNPQQYTGWGLITGSVELEEPLVKAAQRELQEEIGIDLAIEAFCNTGYVSTYQSERQQCSFDITWFYVCLKDETPELKLQQNEWLEYQFLSYSQAHKALTWPTEREALTTICYDYL